MNRQVIEVGAYIFDTKRFLIEKNRQCGLQTAYIIDRELPPEIDSLIDWEINERYFNYWRGVKEYGKNNKAN
jgi:CMP-N-acetylneuraminic acid synthetase